MQNPLISHFSEHPSDTGPTILLNPSKRKWNSVISNSDSPTTLDNALLSQTSRQPLHDAEETIRLQGEKPPLIITSQKFPTLDQDNAPNRSRSQSSSQTPTRIISPHIHLQDTTTAEEISAQPSPSFSLIVEVLASEMMIVKANVHKCMVEKLAYQGGQKWEIAEQLSHFLHQQKHRERPKNESPQIFNELSSQDFLISEKGGGQSAIEFYVLLVAFITVYVSFMEVSTALMASKEFLWFLISPLQTIMESFHPIDNIFHEAANDLYLWYYVDQQKSTTSVTSALQKQLDGLNYTVENAHHAEAILSSFYTNYLLRISAQRHQKDHGQFYTPPSVVNFMWNTCMTDNSNWLNNVQLCHCPSVLDPCMGTGSFLSSYILRIFRSLQVNNDTWNDAECIKQMISSMCSNIWGIEIDHFVFRLGKLNLMLHIFPLCCRWMSITRRSIDFQLPRLRIFCNDILTLSLPQMTSKDVAWEYEQLAKLRDPSALKFDFMVTNPPYMIRKTGFISMPDMALYDMTLIGGRGTQAYMYFMWICLQRCHPLHGKLCFITPSQWILLEFAKSLRSWLWSNYVLEQVYQFEPYKVWPKIQTDSLIFTLRPRTPFELYSPSTLFLRHVDRSLSLAHILEEYESFNIRLPSNHPRVSYKVTPSDINALRNIKDCSFSFLAPSSSVAQQMSELTDEFPRICGPDRDPDHQPPLSWNRGPNTNPVYALLVRTEWALKEFGAGAVQKWMRPAIYWNGKCENGVQRQNVSKEISFWKNRDRRRVSHKENSPAEAYMPFRYEDLGTDDQHYSMVLIDSTNAAILEQTEGTDNALYRYLKEAREELQPKQTNKKVAWCQYRQCGIEYPVKIVHPINFGYFSRSQPRQRFFLDTQRQCVTNQCMYFTIRSTANIQDPLFYLGLLNSTSVQFFISIHCCYDQQGRTRFFAKNMENIPYPPSCPQTLVSLMVNLVLRMTNVRSMIYRVARELRMKVLIEKLRQGRWDLQCTESCVKHHHKQGTPLEKSNITSTQEDDVYGQAEADRICPNKYICSCLRVASLLQYAIDQLSYLLYGVPVDIQLAVESELSINALTAFESVFPRQSASKSDWYDKIMQYSDLILQNVDL